MHAPIPTADNVDENGECGNNGTPTDGVLWIVVLVILSGFCYSVVTHL